MSSTAPTSCVASASRTMSVALSRAVTSPAPRCSTKVSGASSSRSTSPPVSLRPTCCCSAAAAMPRTRVSAPTASANTATAANGADPPATLGEPVTRRSTTHAVASGTARPASNRSADVAARVATTARRMRMAGSSTVRHGRGAAAEGAARRPRSSTENVSATPANAAVNTANESRRRPSIGSTRSTLSRRTRSTTTKWVALPVDDERRRELPHGLRSGAQPAAGQPVPLGGVAQVERADAVAAGAELVSQDLERRRAVRDGRAPSRGTPVRSR